MSYLVAIATIHKYSKQLIPYSILTALPNFRGKGFFLNQKEKNYEYGFIWYFRREEINSVFSNKNSLLEPFFKKNKIEFSDKTVILNNITKFDFVNYLTDDLLVKVDRASMLNSLETRAPFLDKDLVEFAYSKVPSSLKVHKDGTTKYLVKKLLKAKIPTLDIERKQGFSIPLSLWIIKWEKLLISYIESFEEKEINVTYLTELIKNEKKNQNNSYKIYNLLVLLIWKNKYNITLF